MKGERKDHDSLEMVMRVLRLDYTPIVQKIKEQKEMIEAMPEGKERKYLQQEYDDFTMEIDNHLGFKKGLLIRMGIQADPVSFVFSESELADIYERLKDIPFTDKEENIPNAR